MAQNYINSGEVLEYTVPAATTIASGDGVLIGDVVGVALGGGTTGDVIQVKISGAFTMAKKTGTGTAIAQGAKAYWDAADKKVTGSDASGANKHIGYGVVASVNADTTSQVKLLG